MDGPQGADTGPPAKVLLVVDDEPDILELMEIYLEESLPSVDVVRATSGEDALEILQSRHVDMVISDFRMPRMDGIEFLARIQGSHGDIPRVLYTAYADPDLERRAKEEAGVKEVYRKDLSPQALVSRIEEALYPRPEQRSRV